MKSFKEYKYDYGSPESVKLMKKVTPGQKEAINWAKAGTKAQIMHPITRVAKKVDKKDVRKYVDAGWLHMAQKKNRITKEAVYGNQAQRLSSPLQKMRQDKEKADRDKDGKLNMMKGRPKKEAMSPAEKAAHDKAIAAFKAKGGKVKKLKPGYAQGYHGKDDPGSGMRGMLDKGDSKAFGTRKKVKSMGESMRKVAAVQGQMSKINDRLRKNPKHPGAGKDRTDLLDLQRKMVALRKSRNESIDEAINVNDAHTDAQNHSNGSMSVKKVQGKPSLIMKSYHSEKDGHAFAKKHGYKASNYVKTHAGSRMDIHKEMVDPMDLRGRPTKKDPYHGKTKFGLKHPLHPLNIQKRKEKEAKKAAVKKEAVDEAFDARTSGRFQSAEAELIKYAKKSGGMDKGDFMAVAKMLGQIGRLNILQGGQILGKLNRKLSQMDTDPRDKVYSILKSKGLMESIKEDKDPGEYDEEGLMMKDQLDIVMDAADDIYDTVRDNENLPEWCQNKITKAADYIDSVRDYLKSQKTTNEGSGPSMGDLQKRANMKQSDKDKLLKIRQMLDKEKKNRPVK